MKIDRNGDNKRLLFGRRRSLYGINEFKGEDVVANNDGKNENKMAH
jgi:hypothetical protein